MSLRFWCGVGMIPVALFLPFWMFGILAFFYACVWTPYELLIIAMCIDAQFGNPELHAYWYTITVSIFLIMSVYIKPFLRFYA
jgi:hypothetical protein